MLPLDADAVVKLVQAGGTDAHHAGRGAADARSRATRRSRSRPFWITVERGIVTAVDEQFVP